ncbi:serine hydrolase [Candidatus Cloacimonadota bacterium]
MKKISIFVLITLSVICSAQNPMVRKITEIVEAEAQYAYFSGTVIIAENDKIIYRNTFGLANRDFQIPNSFETRYNIGSITKTFTALAIMQLIEAGKLKTTDTLADYLPDCPIPEKNDITIHHLLTHSSGLYDYANDEVIFETLQIREIEEFIPFVYGQGLLFQPGEDLSYSSGGYILLGAIIEKISGLKYSDYLEQNIFKPASMYNSALLYAEDVSPNKAEGYKQLNKEKFENRKLLDFPGSSAGGIYTTAADLLKYFQALVDTKLLSNENINLMLTPNMKQDQKSEIPAYGWWITYINNQKAIFHTGGTPGFSSSLYHFPDQNYTAIVLSNSFRGTTGITDQINNALIEADFETAGPNTYNLRRGIDLFYEGNYSEAIKWLDEIIEIKEPSRRAYYYAAIARIKENTDLHNAIEYLEQYISLTDPASRSSIAYAWYQMGQAYKKLENTGKAKKSYKNSLDTNPDNSYARKALDELKK